LAIWFILGGCFPRPLYTQIVSLSHTFKSYFSIIIFLNPVIIYKRSWNIQMSPVNIVKQYKSLKNVKNNAWWCVYFLSHKRTRNTIDETGIKYQKDIIATPPTTNLKTYTDKTFVVDIYTVNDLVSGTTSLGKVLVPGNVMYTSKKVCVNFRSIFYLSNICSAFWFSDMSYVLFFDILLVINVLLFCSSCFI
jgi:hypothetical protein